MITHSLSPFLYSYSYFNTRKHSTRKLYLPPVMTPLYQKKKLSCFDEHGFETYVSQFSPQIQCEKYLTCL